MVYCIVNMQPDGRVDSWCHPEIARYEVVLDSGRPCLIMYTYYLVLPEAIVDYGPFVILRTVIFPVVVNKPQYMEWWSSW